MKAIGVIRVRFPQEPVECTGQQMAMVLARITEATGPAVWYEADVLAPGPSFNLSPSPVPQQVGSGRDVVQRAQGVDQFEAGVFAAVPVSVRMPRFREHGLSTMDEVDADLADSVVEVRAFDCTFIEVLSSEQAILEAVSHAFGVPVEPVSSVRERHRPP